MYCLVVTDVYSRFIWVFFLAAKDETSGILKSFITRIENLVDHKVKVIRCDNGTEFKNREMNQFCEMKGILRQFSIARTPQQNEVTKRRNRTLTEAARTMLADFKAPTLSFMRPFGCPITIINTIDHLGKFDGKADEGFFVRYSLNSKAFRVFNSKTRIVEENLHIRFSENTPNVVGSGPDWLFDIDALTRTMNYEPVFADLKSSHDDGSKLSSDDGKKVDEDPRKESECSKWGFKNKKDERGIMIRNKVRLVAQGYTQEKRIDYDEVFSLVARIEAIRLFLAYASFKDFVVYQMDVKSAFLYGKIKKEVGKINKTLFIKRHKGDILLIQVYVDDIIFGSTKKELCIAFERLMYKKFKMSSMGELTFFLGLQVYISQDCKHLNGNLKASAQDEDGEEVDVHMYRSMIGLLMYLMSSRSDIMFAVCSPARYQVNPKVSHLHAMKRIFRIRHHFVRDCNEKKLIQIVKIYTDKNVADLLTKAFDVDEAVHKELGDSLVMAATTASSLEAKQDSGNINKTQSKETSNESSSQGPNSGGGPWVLDLEKTTTTQRNEIASLKRKVKKLEKNRSRTHRLNRLYKVDEEINLVSVQDKVVSNDVDKHMFDVDVLDGDEVFIVEHEVASKGVNDEVNVVKEVVKVINTAKLIINAAQDSAAGDIVSTASAATTVSAATITTATITTVGDITLAQALKEIKRIKPKEKGIVIQELGESTTTSSQQSQNKCKGILTEPVIELMKTMKRKDQIRLDEEANLKLQAAFNEEERLAREKAEKVKEDNIALIKT
nr:retrovirus-related Pol polyprotein from transposon TNT 1-94 [Tanacetum cinerariifolium]